MGESDNIFFGELTDEQLIKYVQGNLSEEELLAIEKILADSEFMKDAVEGLKSFSSDKNLHAYVHQLNKSLHQQLGNRNKRDKFWHVKQLYWAILTVIIILLLCLAGYFIVRMERKKEDQIKNHYPVSMKTKSSFDLFV